jgi:hypothetical protein
MDELMISLLNKERSSSVGLSRPSLNDLSKYWLLITGGAVGTG